MFFLINTGITAPEIETGADFLVGLIDGVADFNHVGFGNYIKRWHSDPFVYFLDRRRQ